MDERSPEKALGGLVFSSTAPGGFEQASASLARKVIRDFSDLEELSTVTFSGAGGEIAGEYRLEGSPRTWGAQSSVQPQLNGWQAHLEDDNSAAVIFLDRDLTKFAQPGTKRQIDLVTASDDISTWSFQALADQGGHPALSFSAGGPLPAANQVCEAWYDAGSALVARIRCANIVGSNLMLGDGSNVIGAYTVSDDIVSADAGGNVLPAASFDRLTTAYKYALIQVIRSAAGGSAGETLGWFLENLSVLGPHGIATVPGPSGTIADDGILASDAVAYTLGRWAPKLSFTTGPNGTIQPSSFPIPQLAFPNPGTSSAILKQAASFELLDWFVWENQTFWMNRRGKYARSRNWRARTGEAQLQETGPSMSRLWNGAIIIFTDEAGVQRSVGPPGSGCNFTDPSLLDPDPLNPANQAGIRRWAPPIQMGSASAVVAIRTGQLFLQEQKLLDTSGQATLVGYVMDDKGVLWPAWNVRAGDTLAIIDAADPAPRRIVRAEYTDASKTCAVSLDAPPEGMQELLARLSIGLSPLGLS